MRRDTRIVAAFLASAAALILGASMLCAWAVAHGASPRWRVLFRVMCHGIERRCLTMFGVPMPICARCTAIYIGLIAGVAVFMVIPLLEERVMRVIVYAAAVPMLIDGLTQATGLRESTNGIRIVTGLVAAVAFSMWAVTAVEEGGRVRVREG
ncbi:MAG TPA: DUF2085 domain-containing protein [Thermoanaerobaculia bacterium]